MRQHHWLRKYWFRFKKRINITFNKLFIGRMCKNYIDKCQQMQYQIGRCEKERKYGFTPLPLLYQNMIEVKINIKF